MLALKLSISLTRLKVSVETNEPGLASPQGMQEKQLEIHAAVKVGQVQVWVKVGPVQVRVQEKQQVVQKDSLEDPPCASLTLMAS